MTEIQPTPGAGYRLPGSSQGCTECGSHDTATVDGINGRRCAQHPSRFDIREAAEIAAKGLPGAAIAYVRTWAAEEEAS